MPGSIQYSIALRSNGADTDKQVTSKTHEYNIYENKNRIIIMSNNTTSLSGDEKYPHFGYLVECLFKSNLLTAHR